MKKLINKNKTTEQIEKEISEETKKLMIVVSKYEQLKNTREMLMVINEFNIKNGEVIPAVNVALDAVNYQYNSHSKHVNVLSDDLKEIIDSYSTSRINKTLIKNLKTRYKLQRKLLELKFKIAAIAESSKLKLYLVGINDEDDISNSISRLTKNIDEIEEIITVQYSQECGCSIDEPLNDYDYSNVLDWTYTYKEEPEEIKKLRNEQAELLKIPFADRIKKVFIGFEETLRIGTSSSNVRSVTIKGNKKNLIFNFYDKNGDVIKSKRKSIKYSDTEKFLVSGVYEYSNTQYICDVDLFVMMEETTDEALTFPEGNSLWCCNGLLNSNFANNIKKINNWRMLFSEWDD